MTSDDMPDRSNLADLYPTAKTFAEHQADMARLASIERARRPQHLAIRTALQLTAYWLGLVAAVWLTKVAASLGIIVEVCIAFGLSLLLFGVGILTWKNIVRNYELYSINIQSVLLVCCVLSSLSVIGWLLGSKISLIVVTTWSVVHSVLVWLMLRILNRKSQIGDH